MVPDAARMLGVGSSLELRVGGPAWHSCSGNITSLTITPCTKQVGVGFVPSVMCNDRLKVFLAG